MLHTAKFYLKGGITIPPDDKRSIESLYQYIGYDFISIPDMLELISKDVDYADSVYVAFVGIENMEKVEQLARRLIALRIMHIELEEYEVIHEPLFIYNGDFRHCKLETFLEMFNIGRDLDKVKKMSFLDVANSRENISDYCLAHPDQELWSLFFKSKTLLKEEIDKLPKDSKVLYCNEDLHPSVEKFMNCIVRTNIDFACEVSVVDGIRIEHPKPRYLICGLISQYIDFLCNVILNDFSAGVS